MKTITAKFCCGNAECLNVISATLDRELSTATGTCPKCGKEWQCDPRSLARRRQRFVMAGAAVLSIVAACWCWWALQSRQLGLVRDRLISAQRLRDDGDLAGADSAVGQATTDLDNVGLLCPLLFSERDSLRAEIKIHALLIQLAKTLEEADVDETARGLHQLENDLGTAARNWPSDAAQQPFRRLQASASTLSAEFEKTRQQKKALAEIAASLNEAKVVLAQDKWKLVDDRIDEVRPRLLKLLGEQAVSGIRQERARLVNDLDALQTRWDSAYETRLKDSLSGLDLHLAKQEFLVAQQKIDHAIKQFPELPGRPWLRKVLGQDASKTPLPDPVLEEIRRFMVKLSHGKGTWGEKQKRHLNSMVSEAGRWRKVCKTDSRDAYVSFVSTYPNSPFVDAAQARIVHLEVKDQIEHSLHNSLEEPRASLAMDRDSGFTLITVKNDTEFEVTVRYSGPEAHKVVLLPHRSTDLSVASGIYVVTSVLGGGGKKDPRLNANVQVGRGFPEHGIDPLVLNLGAFVTIEPRIILPGSFTDTFSARELKDLKLAPRLP